MRPSIPSLADALAWALVALLAFGPATVLATPPARAPSPGAREAGRAAFAQAEVDYAAGRYEAAIEGYARALLDEVERPEAFEPTPPRVVAPAAPPKLPAASPSPPPLTARWWFWAGVGVLAGGVAAAVIATRPGEPPPTLGEVRF